MTYYRASYIICRFSVLAGVIFLGVGLWQHSWKVIVAALALIAIAPLVVADARDALETHRREVRFDGLWDDDQPPILVRMDRVWDDDDLSGSA